MAEDGLALAPLLASLVPSTLLFEADQPWTFESLLREVSEEINELPKPATKATANNANSTVKPSKGTKKSA